MQIKDDLGREVRFSFPPQRIVSLCPSQTETLFDLGLGPQVVGITQYCHRPRGQVSHCARVGGTKTLKGDEIAQLKPDLVIAEKEENPREAIEALAEKVSVFVTDVVDVESALRMILTLGQLGDREVRARQWVEQITQAQTECTAIGAGEKVAYLIWYKPWMGVAQGTFIHSMLETVGFKNALAEGSGESRYPEVDLQSFKKQGVERIFLSTEPFPFREKHVAIVREECGDLPIEIVDGEIWSWYGTRMLESFKKIQKRTFSARG